MSKAKIQSWAKIATTVSRLRSQGKSMVFTNGCFDILHAGHVLYLEQAKARGDVLIVGLNSDSSVTRLKGNNRPVVPQKERSLVLAALESVDYVVVFDQDTPYELIQLIQPDVLVKGGDWQPEDIVGSDIVLKRGGTVRSLSYQKGLSTTSIIERIEKSLSHSATKGKQ